MLKYQKILQKSSLKKDLLLWRPKRTKFTENQKEANVKLYSKLVLAGVGCTAITGLTTISFLGYVSWSTKNRQKVENEFPSSRYLLNFIFGVMAEQGPPSIALPPIQEEFGPLQKKLERERNKVTEDIIIDEVEPKIVNEIETPIVEELSELPNINEINDVVEPLPMEPKEINDVVNPLPVKIPKDELEKRNESNEIEDKDPINNILENMITEVRKYSLEALAAAETATSAIHEYYESAYHAIDSVEGRGDLYAIASEAATQKGDLMKLAEEKLSTAKQGLSSLRSTIDEARHSSAGVDDDIISNANKVVDEVADQIAKNTSIVSEAIRDCSAVGELVHMVEEGKKQFESEIKSLLPDIKIGESVEQLTKDDLNLLLAHAHKKVLLMQGELARNQTLNKNTPTASEDTTSYNSRYAEAKLKMELDRQKDELSTLHRHRMSELREELESQLHGQLKRQAAAHSDHLTDALRLQQSELDRKWKNILHDGMQQVQLRYVTALASIDGELSGLKEGIASRAKVNEDALNANKLWTACEAFKSKLRLSVGHTWSEKLKPIKENIDAIRTAAGDEKEFVEVVLGSLPEESMSRGVYTEEALRERFIKVERICRRVAIIGDGGGSLVKYFISYIKSFLLADTYDLLTTDDMKNEEIDITTISTVDILARTKYCLEKDDFLQSIKYMKLLRGEPRNVASDWVREALLTMEARQVADVLMTFAAATVGRSL